MKTGRFSVFILVLAVTFMSSCNSLKGEQKNQSTISLFGTGTVLVQPDMIQMTITLSKVDQTTKMAQDEVNKMVRQALTIIKEAGIEDKNIATASLTFHSEYEYTSRRILVGQKAEQRITFTIDNINNGDEKVSRIIDQFIQIDGIELNQINFGVKNNTGHFVRSRDLAFQKAVEKANQYAELSNLKIIKILSISEEMDQHVLPISNRSLNQSMIQEAAGGGGSAIVPSGELEITTRILVTFLLE
ncbi:MAG: SIMPL domain-containing protein [Treponema sp.]|jgi:uncharacterized protein YggE|nr:SIMPL domain-containing protein [Treponema sp.]